MNVTQQFELVKTLGEAKSRQDVRAAMKVQHENMLLETPAFGSTVRGKAANAAVLEHFFQSFPDYNVHLEGYAGDGKYLLCWGTVCMTMTGRWFGLTGNGHQTKLPVFLRFTFKDDLIASEYFLFDLAEFCAQSGVSTDAVRAQLFVPRTKEVQS